MTTQSLPDASATTLDGPTEPAGLLVGDAGAPIPLEAVDFEAVVSGGCARAVLSQRYRNRETQPIEAVYVFPIEEGAAVCGFEAWIGEVHVVAEVMEREQAFETYDDAVTAGHGAYLLDEERPDVFTASLGNVPPGAEVTIRVSTVLELPFEGEAVRLTLPTTIGPRYAPAEDQVSIGAPPAETLNPPTQPEVSYRLDVRVEVEMESAIRSVESPSHPISVETDGCHAVVTLATRDTALDQDFVVLVREAEPFRPQSIVEIDAQGRRFACLSLRPRFEAQEAPSEFVFLVDRSGSMTGSSIAEARNALQLCLRSLPDGSWFNIVGFGSSFERLFPESRPVDEASLAEATEHLARLDADLGGTEILSPLEAVLKAEPLKGLPRQIFLMTDGDVTNSDAVLRLVRAHAGNTRLFAFGIGHAPSRHLVQGVARTSGGQAEFIVPGERIEAKVMRQLARAVAPAFTDVTLDWGSLETTPAPHRAPAVFAVETVRVYAELASEAPGRLTLRANGPDGPVEIHAEIDPASARPGDTLSRLWARTRIRDLEEGVSELHQAGGSQRRERREERIRAEIVRLGSEYGLASRETSFVAVEKRQTPTGEEAVLRRVPIALAKDWGGTGEMFACLDTSFFGASDAQTLSAPAFHRMSTCSSHQMGLVADLARTVGCDLADLENALTEALDTVPDETARRAFATALALAFLSAEAADERNEWRRLARRAERWLAAHGTSIEPKEGWSAIASAAFG